MATIYRVVCTKTNGWLDNKVVRFVSHGYPCYSMDEALKMVSYLTKEYGGIDVAPQFDVVCEVI